MDGFKIITANNLTIKFEYDHRDAPITVKAFESLIDNKMKLVL